MENPNRYLELIKQLKDQLDGIDLTLISNISITASYIISDLVGIRDYSIDDLESMNYKYINAVYQPQTIEQRNLLSVGYNEDLSKLSIPNLVSVDYDLFDLTYVKVASHQPSSEILRYVEINGHRYNYTALTMDALQDPQSYFKKIGIGLRSSHYLTIWFVKDGDLYVAIPYMSALAKDDGCCRIVAGGIPYTLYVHKEYPGNIQVKTVGMTCSTSKYPAVAKYINSTNSIEVIFTHSSQCLYITLKSGDISIIDSSTYIYKFDPLNGNLAILNPGIVCGNIPCTYATYLIPCDNKPVVNQVTMEKSVTLKIINYGTFTFDINFDAVVQE